MKKNFVEVLSKSKEVYGIGSMEENLFLHYCLGVMQSSMTDEDIDLMMASIEAARQRKIELALGSFEYDLNEMTEADTRKAYIAHCGDECREADSMSHDALRNQLLIWAEERLKSNCNYRLPVLAEMENLL